MRVMSWNTNWNVSLATLAEQTDAVAELAPDVAFFSEWSPEPTRTSTSGKPIASNGHLRAPSLREIGLTHQCHEHASNYGARPERWARLHWGILAASSEPIHKAPLDNPTFAPGSWLEVVHEPTDLVVVGVRVPAWEGSTVHLRRDLWRWMSEQFDRLADRPAIVLGDFNTEMQYPTERATLRHGGDLLRSLTRKRGWRDTFDVNPLREVSTVVRNNGRSARLDYAFASPVLAEAITTAAAPTRVGRHILAGSPRDAAGNKVRRLSDHSPVVVDLDPSHVGVSA
jgi:endonuclease/exonuclease/phosphatase family metal-dependent hydrolase